MISWGFGCLRREGQPLPRHLETVNKLSVSTYFICKPTNPKPCHKPPPLSKAHVKPMLSLPQITPGYDSIETQLLYPRGPKIIQLIQSQAARGSPWLARFPPHPHRQPCLLPLDQGWCFPCGPMGHCEPFPLGTGCSKFFLQCYQPLPGYHLITPS